MNITNELEIFVLNELAADRDMKSIAPDEDLLMQGIIDSLGIMRLSAFMEEKFGIQIADRDMVPENFQSINSLKGFIESKQQS